eukprot:g3419.t1
MARFKIAKELHSDARRADLLAYKEMRVAGQVVLTDVGKHPAGVKLSTAFESRAELAIAGVHHQLVRGISTDQKTGVAESIVYSGYYAANEDKGDSFIYSGEGGVLNGVQIADQDWTRGNVGLTMAHEMKTPIRVVRCILDEFKVKKYYYEGLYQITKWWTEDRNGFDVCLFEFHGIEGEYSISGEVKHNPKAFVRSK